MKTILSYFFCFLSISSLFAQKEANIWYFGANAGLDFNSGTPVALLDGALDTIEGCATISDTDGNLLFYTDGITVFNKNHTIMLNGMGLNGDTSTTQSALIVPKPNDENTYYIFTVAARANADGLQYSEVNMQLDGGLGGVTTNKNKRLYTPTAEKITAIKSSIENAFWVLSHKANSNEFIAYKITETGVNPTPVISAIGTTVTGSGGLGGQIKISPDGTKLAVARTQKISEAQLFDFDASTGKVSNPMTLTALFGFEDVYGLEFSPNSKVLYVSILGTGVFQYNLEAGTPTAIADSQLELTTSSAGYAGMQLATDGKIYIAKSNQKYIDFIDQPDEVGFGCGYQFESLYLGDGDRFSKLGLPPFIQSFLFTENILLEKVCFGDATKFSLTGMVDSASWNFGDPASGVNNTSTSLAPSHVFTASGTYEVSVTVTVGAQSTSTTTSVIIYELATAKQPSDMNICDTNNDGFSEFDLSTLPITLKNGQSDLIVELFDSNNTLIPEASYSNFKNLTINQDYVKGVLTNTITGCSSEALINITISNNPIANPLSPLYGCDDNNDGISEYFDTSNVKTQVLNGQTGMNVSYFTENGITLTSPLPNPFTNNEPNTQYIIVRVTNTSTSTDCYQETTLELQTVTQPNINQPENLYACDQGSGYSEFDTSTIKEQIIGNQTGLTIKYYDSNNNPLPSPLPVLYQNTEPFSQVINIRVEDISNSICYSETSFELIVNSLPEINLDEEYFICNLKPSISLNINYGFNSYNWFFEDGTLISGTNSAEIIEEGSYTLTVTQMENGITCENSFDFNLIRSDLPEIQQINYGVLGNNYIEIIASGDGNFEYSIDGINYQDGNYFSNIQGGIYAVFVRDKDGCGEDSNEVIIIDYPKFFTPNNDGYNDLWQIKGISEFPNSEILIFDRCGKLLTQLASNDLGWNGLYNGKKMMSNDYWFRANLGNGQVFSGHFSLKR